MKLKTFSEYNKNYSKDPKTFEKRVALASSQNYGANFFKHISEENSHSFSNLDIPVIIWNNFKAPSINENSSNIFNRSSVPTNSEIYSSFEGETFIPKFTSERVNVKKLKFPIVGIGDSTEEFKTYGKLKRSEKIFTEFREKIVPDTSFDVICFKDAPIHVQEKVKSLGFDVDLATFEHLTQLEKITERIGTNYKLDFYHLNLLEKKGVLYFNTIGTSLNLSPSQSIKMYETAYFDHYSAKLPNWFKKQLFESNVKPYYKKRYYDSALIKPKYSIDFKKYI